MSAFEIFKNELNAWFNKNSINSVYDISFCDIYAYSVTTHTISIGTDYDIPEYWFVDYLEQKGCRCYGIPIHILAFLHEVGHSCTLHSLMERDEKFFDRCQFKKLACSCDSKENCFDYWNVDDEVAANDWEVQFINGNQDAVVELYDIWEKFMSELVNDIFNRSEGSA